MPNLKHALQYVCRMYEKEMKQDEPDCIITTKYILRPIAKLPRDSVFPQQIYYHLTNKDTAEQYVVIHYFNKGTKWGTRGGRWSIFKKT